MKAIGIILAGGNSSRMQGLTSRRAIAAMPVAGSYRAVDFALSNMTNSHIQKVAVLTQYSSRSLHEHLNSSKWWDFGRKQGGLYLFAPTITQENGFWYRGTADALYQNMDFLQNSHEPYVVIASGDGIYKLDYNQVINAHIESLADITVVTTELPAGMDNSRFGTVVTDEENRIVSFEEKPLQSETRMVSTGIYVIRRRLLMDLLEKTIRDNNFDFVSGVLTRYKNQKKICAFKMDGYWSNIATVEDYFRTNMDFLNKEVRDYFFKQYPDIYSKVDDLPPAKFNPSAVVRNSLVSSGSIVDGTVENSVIFKKVYIGNNVTIKNSIILNDVQISDGAYIENCIVESRGTISAGSRYVGEGEICIVDEKVDRY
ncbi:MAG: glucose-1-phosphate adenylyltransferase subunit GlgD [Lachnospiraceae bacterium]|nr:glucose-1-phosphate adenylyltransferase subunit GlgD [Lachnospiraceae bacterium]